MGPSIVITELGIPRRVKTLFTLVRFRQEQLQARGFGVLPIEDDSGTAQSIEFMLETESIENEETAARNERDRSRGDRRAGVSHLRCRLEV